MGVILSRQARPGNTPVIKHPRERPPPRPAGRVSGQFSSCRYILAQVCTVTRGSLYGHCTGLHRASWGVCTVVQSFSRCRDYRLDLLSPQSDCTTVRPGPPPGVTPYSYPVQSLGAGVHRRPVFLLFWEEGRYRYSPEVRERFPGPGSTRPRSRPWPFRPTSSGCSDWIRSSSRSPGQRSTSAIG
jgi:hypothetical protein